MANKTNNFKSKFSKDSLPDPKKYYESMGVKFLGSKEWQITLCSFHEDTRQSLSVNIKSGAYRCFACGASGGDILSFHMRKTRLNFVDACKQLGAWVSI